MNIFMTGATGNVGEAVLKELIAEKHNVTCLVRKKQSMEGVKFIKGNVKKIGKVSKYINEADGIIHLASPRSLDIMKVLEEDIVGMHYILQNWRRGKFVFSSSQTVYGIPRDALTEGTPLNPVCWYDLGKIINEFQISMTDPLENSKAGISLRIPLLFGCCERMLDRQFLFEVYKAVKSKATFVFDSHEGYESYGTSFLGDKDCGRAFVKSLEIVKSGVYNISSGFCTWKDLLGLLSQYTKTSLKIKIQKDTLNAGFFRLPQSKSLLDVSKFEKQTGLKGQDNIEEIIEHFVDRLDGLFFR